MGFQWTTRILIYLQIRLFLLKWNVVEGFSEGGWRNSLTMPTRKVKLVQMNTFPLSRSRLIASTARFSKLSFKMLLQQIRVCHKHSPQNIPRNECCCCEQPIPKQQNFFTAIWLDAHNNNIRSVGYFVGYDEKWRKKLSQGYSVFESFENNAAWV